MRARSGKEHAKAGLQGISSLVVRLSGRRLALRMVFEFPAPALTPQLDRREDKSPAQILELERRALLWREVSSRGVIQMLILRRRTLWRRNSSLELAPYQILGASENTQGFRSYVVVSVNARTL